MECLAILVLLFASVAPNREVRALISQFEARYRSAKTLQATFLERYLENGRVVRVEAGIAYFRRPGRMRWDYESPEKNLFLIDGKNAWFYVPRDHTVTRVPAKESSDWRTPLALLAGETKVSRVCAQVRLARDEKPESPANAVFDCAIRSEHMNPPGVSSSSAIDENGDSRHSVLFEIVKTRGELVRVLVRDPGGVSLEFHFKDWVTDPALPEKLFQFQVPQGVAIVNGPLASDENKMIP